MDLALTFPACRQQLSRRRDLLDLGISSAALSEAVDNGSIVRIRRGVYAPGPLPRRGRHLISDGVQHLGYLAAVRAVLLSLPAGAVAARRTAAVLWCMDMLVEPKQVEIRLGRGQECSMSGVAARASRITAHLDLEVRGLSALAVTTAVDTVLDCALDRPMREAVVIGDSALRRGVVTTDELIRAVDARARHPRSTRLRRLVAHLDPKSGSVLESILRYLLVQDGLQPRTQYVVSRGATTIGRFDFAFELARLIVECDGRRWHDPDDARRRDRHRDIGVARLGWTVLRFSWDEILNSPAFVLAAIRECLDVAKAA